MAEPDCWARAFGRRLFGRRDCWAQGLLGAGRLGAGTVDNVHEVALHNPPADVPLEEHELATLNNLRERLLRHLDRVQHFIR